MRDTVYMRVDGGETRGPWVRRIIEPVRLIVRRYSELVVAVTMVATLDRSGLEADDLPAAA
jgi:hypothetical protein